MSSVDVSSAADRVFESAKDVFLLACRLLAGNRADQCESSIELMLLVALELMNSLYSGPNKRTLCHFSVDGPTPEPTPIMVITPQYQWGNYRIDIRVDCEGLEQPLFIECDGHDFHERTKEQAERDRSRDRAIQEAGISVLRFTGREIYRNPMDCAFQIMKFRISRLEALRK